MCKACSRAGLPAPQFEEYQGFRVIFRKDIYTEEHLSKLGLNKRQIKAVMYVKEKGKITNKEYQELNAVSNKTAYLELSDVVEKGVLLLEGSGRMIGYILKGNERVMKVMIRKWKQIKGIIKNSQRAQMTKAARNFLLNP